jgi:predicted phosphodiesterase
VHWKERQVMKLKYALLADIHGNTANLERVLECIHSRQNIDGILCLGDLIDVKISKKEMNSRTRYTLDEVVQLDERLLAMAETFQLLEGNQEERLLQCLDHSVIPPDLAQALGRMQKDLFIGPARFTHGHTFEFAQYGNLPCYYPLVSEWDRPWIFYGHNHQHGLYTVHRSKDCWIYERQAFELGKPVSLNNEVRTLINIGDIRRSTPSWACYDTESSTVIFYTLDKEGEVVNRNGYRGEVHEI